MTQKLTTAGLLARLPLLNLRGVCEQAGVKYSRYRNWRFGAVKSLSEDELDRIAAVLRTIPPKK